MKAEPSCSSSSSSVDVACDTRISPPLPAAQMRAARWMAMPWYSPSETDASPVWIPIRTRRLHAVRPFVRGERALRGERGAHRVLRPAEGDEEPVSLRPDALAARLLEGAAQQPVVVREHVAPPIPDSARELRRALDIAEEKREGAARRVDTRPEDCHARRLRGSQVTGSVAWSR